jgi:hypothetical protein
MYITYDRKHICSCGYYVGVFSTKKNTNIRKAPKIPEHLSIFEKPACRVFGKARQFITLVCPYSIYPPAADLFDLVILTVIIWTWPSLTGLWFS